MFMVYQLKSTEWKIMSKVQKFYNIMENKILALFCTHPHSTMKRVFIKWKSIKLETFHFHNVLHNFIFIPFFRTMKILALIMCIAIK